MDGAVTIQGFTTCTINLAACLVVAEFCSIPCAGVFVPPLTAGAVWACLGCIAGAGYYCTTAYSQALNDSTANAYKAGILLVAAVGNSGDGNLSTDDVLYPAKFDSVIAVSAVDSNNIAPVWSADGAKIEIQGIIEKILYKRRVDLEATIMTSGLECPPILTRLLGEGAATDYQSIMEI